MVTAVIDIVYYVCTTSHVGSSWKTKKNTAEHTHAHSHTRMLGESFNNAQHRPGNQSIQFVRWWHRFMAWIHQ